VRPLELGREGERADRLAGELEVSRAGCGSTTTVIVVAVPMRTPLTPAKCPLPPVKVWVAGYRLACVRASDGDGSGMNPSATLPVRVSPREFV
jgi:hypothetical protein